MAIPTTRPTFKDYCLRNLGFGVIDINVSDAQIDDRIDEALQYFAQYHYDGIERMYLKHKIIQRMYLEHKIIKHFGDGKKFGVKIRYIKEKKAKA